jgi:hypothetical protein
VSSNGIFSLTSGGGNISIKGKSSLTNGGGHWAWGVGFNTTASINSGTGTVSIDGVSQGGVGDYSSGVLFNLSGLTTSITSANTTANAIKIVGDATTALNPTWNQGIRFYYAGASITATGSGGGITLQGTRHVGGSLYDIYFQGGNILANGGAINISGQSAGGSLYLVASTTIGKANTGTVTSSASNITLTGDAVVLGAASTVDTSGTLTVQPYSTSFTSALSWPMTNLALASTVSGLTLGKAGNTADITVASATSIAGPISIYAGNINLNANLTSTLSGAAILAKASGNIVQAASTSVTTSNGNVTYWADSDNSGQGYIALNAGNTLTTGGGKIVLAGGLDDGGTNAGLTGLTANDGTPDGYAKTTAAPVAYNTVDGAGVSVGLAGNTGSSVNLLSGGGDIVIRGQGAAATGVTSQDTFKIDSGTGRVDMQGKSTGTYGLRFSWLGTPNWAISSANTTADAITVAGQGGLLLGNVGSGNMLIQATGVGGGVNLSGVITSTGASWGTYISNASATTQILAQSGPINLTGFKSGTANDFYSAGSLYLGNRKDATAINGVTPLVTGSSANITFNVDSFNLANSTTYLSSTGTLTGQPYSTSFDSAQAWGITPTSTFTGLQLGKLGNTADITVSSAQTIAGPISIYGGNITLNAGLTATGTNTISLTGTGNVTEGGSGYVSADKLALLGGNVTLTNASNAIGTLAASGVSGLSYVDSNALTIGVVNPTGITATGKVSISTLTGDLTVANNISTTDATTNTEAITSNNSNATAAVVLNAGVNTAHAVSTGGSIIVTGGSTISTGAGGRALLFTGGVADSTGLGALVGSSSGRFRYNSDEVYAGYTSTLGTGMYAIFREQPTITVTGITGAEMTYGGALPTLTTATGYQNGDTSVVSTSVSGTPSSSGNYTAGSHVTTPSTSDSLGYAITNGGTGTLVVAQKVLTVSYAGVDKVYDGGLTSSVTTTGDNRLSGDVLSVSGYTAAFVDKNAGSAKAVSVTGAGLSGTDAGNYSVGATGSATANITKKPLTATAADAGKTYDGTTTAAPTLSLAGLVGLETLVTTASGTYDNANAGSRTVTVNNVVLANGTAGGLAANYSLASGQTATGVTISKAPLIVSGLTASSKTYDGQTTATVTTTATSFNGKIGSDDVTIATASGNFADKNVGSGKTVNLTGITLGGSAAGNYQLTSTTASTSADITRLNSVTWTGGPTGNWFDPKNWAGGAVPDLANVANVVVPAGVTVSFDTTGAAAGVSTTAVGIDSLGSSAGSMSMANGTLNVANTVTLAALTQSGGALTAGGAVNVADLAQNGGSISSASLTVTNSFGQAGGTITTTGDVSINQTSGPTTLGNIAAGGTLGVTAVGDITQTSGSAIAVTGATTLAVTGAGSNIVLGNTGNDFSSVTASGTNVTLTDVNGLSTNVTASGNANLTAGGALTAVLAVTGNSSLTAGGNLTLSGTTTDLSTTTTGTGTTSFGATSVGGNLSTTSAGDVSQTGPLSVTGTTLLNALGQNVTLDNPANDFGGAVSATANNLVLVDSNGITIDDITTSGTLGVIALTGNVRKVVGATVSAIGNITITAPNGTVAAGLMPTLIPIPIPIPCEAGMTTRTMPSGTPACAGTAAPITSEYTPVLLSPAFSK